MSKPAHTTGPYTVFDWYALGGLGYEIHAREQSVGQVYFQQDRATERANADLFALAPDSHEIAVQALALRAAEQAHERLPDRVNAEIVANIREVLDVLLAEWTRRRNGEPSQPPPAARS